MDVEIYDIETLKNCYTHCSLNRDNIFEEFEFIIHKDQNDLLIYIEHLNKLKGQIGYNNLAFDGQVIQYILENHKEWISWELDGEQISKLIYDYAQYVINKMNNGGWSDYPEWKMKIHQLDLFKIWHFDNKAKMTSLKWIEYMINMNNIEEMPIHHSQFVTLKQIKEEIIPYNKHDIRATYELYKITKGETDLKLYKGIDKIQLRKDIQSQFGIKCLNYNDVKIGDEINKQSYFKLSGCDKKTLPKPIKSISKYYFKDCFPNYMKFQTLEFNNFINALSNIEVSLKKETNKNNKAKKQEFEFTYNDTIYTIAKGGLHSKDKPRIIKPLDNEILRDADIGSQYPNAIRKRKLFPKHLGEKWLTGYTDIIQKRMDAKSLYKKTKEGKYQAIQEAYKLSLNGGGYGKLGEEFNWQYDSFIMNCVTIGNQIEILMLIESLELNGIHVVSANTDGIVSLFDKSLEDLYYKTCKEWEILVGNDVLGQLEYCDYKLFAQTSVNDYITIKIDGESKTKGDFVSDFELHKNKSARIVPLALQEYFINNIPIEQTISFHKDIFDFCLGVKSIGKNRLTAFNKKEQTEVELQKINRYYISNKGIHLLKKLPKLEGKKALMQLDIFGGMDDGTRQSEVEAGWVSIIFNKYVKKEIKDYDICHKFYIDRCNKIINKINGTM